MSLAFRGHVTSPLRRADPAETLADRVEQLRRFVAATEQVLPEERLTAARGIATRAGERLALSREHTVAALAGATGGGKSSLFNALAGVELSLVGVRRPTTGTTYACAWGPGDVGPLLDWLGVSRRFIREAQPGVGHGDRSQEELRGLVLLDLPDFDSVESSHRVEADRLLAVADVVVWVLDPQKYADRVVHQQYLARFHRHRDITVVVLNQADRLDPHDLDRCLSDLRRLLDADGLAGVTLIATSAVDPVAQRGAVQSGDRVEPPGTGQLREVLERTVAARLAALRRLAGDVDEVVADLQPFVGTAGPADLDRSLTGPLTNALADAGGVPLVVAATEKAYTHRAVATAGWPPLRWLRRLRPDPLGRLRLGRRADATTARGPAAPVAATSIGPAGPAARARLGLALRAIGEQAGAPLPRPWSEALLAAARSRMDDLPDALDVAIARTDLGLGRRPFWWRAIGSLQWLLALSAVVGLLWLGVRYVLFALALPEPPLPHVGRLPLPTVLFVGGLLAGLLLAALIRPVIGIAARRAARRAAVRMRRNVEEVGRHLVVAPVQKVLRAHEEARAALAAAARPR